MHKKKVNHVFHQIIEEFQYLSMTSVDV